MPYFKKIPTDRSYAYTWLKSHIDLGSLLIYKAARLDLVISVQKLQLLYGWEETILVWWLETKNDCRE